MLSTPGRSPWGPALGILAAVTLAGCGESPPAAPSGPYASPALTPPAQVVRNGCDVLGKNANASHDVTFVQTALLRQGTDLQRVDDTINNAVPGGDFATDSALAARDATELKKAIETSTLCLPLRTNLAKAAATLVDADKALVATGGGDAAAGALKTARDAYKALSVVAAEATSS